MAVTDALLNLVPPGSPLSLVGSVAVASAIIDILGNGPGQAPTSIIGLPSSGLFGEDSGLGMDKPQLQVNPGLVIAGTTLNIAFQGAPDSGAGGGYQPGLWQTFEETGPITVAQFLSAINRGKPIYRADWPPAFPDNYNPRFLRVLFSPAAGGTFSAGTIAAAFVTMVRDDWSIGYQPRNFSVANVV